ncbi:MAG: YncE family protein [Wenzhouxiangella sp.]|jgi:YVTN family beta-propeller protein|nr:YncE family protein [Wenzhouxiangella sp.]
MLLVMAFLSILSGAPTLQAQDVVHITKPQLNRGLYFDAGATQWSGLSYFTACGPYAIVGNSDGTRIYTSANCFNGNHQMTIVDTSSGTPIEIGRLPQSGGVFDIAIHPDDSRVYLPDFFGNQVRVLDTSTNSYLPSISLNAGPFGIQVAPSGSFAFVSLTGAGTVRRIDLATNTVVGDPINSGPGAYEIAFSPDSQTAFVTNRDTFNPGSVTVIDVGTAAGTKIIAVGNKPEGIAMQPDGTKLYVANRFSGSVSVISLEPDTCLEPVELPPCISATIPVGGEPVDVAFTRDGTAAYVTNASSNNVHEIDTATDTIVRSLSLNTNPNHPPRGVAVISAPPPPPPEPLEMIAVPSTFVEGGNTFLSVTGGVGTPTISITEGLDVCSLDAIEVTGLMPGECTVEASTEGPEGETVSVRLRVVSQSGVDLQMSIRRILDMNDRTGGTDGDCELDRFEITLLNRGPEVASAVRLQGPVPEGLASDVQWTCTVASGNCAPAIGTAGLDTDFALDINETAVIEWQGCPDPAAAWIGVRANASLEGGAVLLLPENAGELFFEGINGDGLFRDRFR